MSLRYRLQYKASTIVREKRDVFDPVLSLIGGLSRSQEGRLRTALKFPRAITEIKVDPLGQKLVNSFCMTTARGTEQSARAVDLYGWTGFEHPFPVVLAAALAETRGAFVDIGTNTGLYTLLARSMYPGRDIIAYEPYPPILRVFEENVRLSPLLGKIDLRRVAVSDRAGGAKLYVPSQEHGLVETSASLEASFRAAHSEVVDVPMVRLSDDVGDVPVGLIKIDVEGAEVKVLAGSQELIERDRPIVLCEILGETDTWTGVEQIIAGLGYRAAAIREDEVAVVAKKDEAANNYLLFSHEASPQVESICARAALRYCHE